MKDEDEGERKRNDKSRKACGKANHNILLPHDTRPKTRVIRDAMLQVGTTAKTKNKQCSTS